MEKNQKLREIGLKEYVRWEAGPWRGYRIIGRFIIHRYGLLDSDLKIMKNKKNVIYVRRSVHKKRKMLRELEGGINKDEETKESFERETSKGETIN